MKLIPKHKLRHRIYKLFNPWMFEARTKEELMEFFPDHGEYIYNFAVEKDYPINMEFANHIMIRMIIKHLEGKINK